MNHLYSRIGAGLLGVLGACAAPELVPLVPSEDGVATVQESGVALSAEVQAGSHVVPSSLTPIKISVTNNAAEPVYVALEDIELELVAEGVTSEAVPPQRIKPRRPPGLGIDPASPYASQSPTSGSGVAPQGGGSVMEPSTAYATGTGSADPVAPGEPAGRREIVEQAFDGGYIDSGETEHGFVYFEKPSREVGRLRLRVTVHKKDGATPVEVLEIPYSVKS